MQMRIKNCCNHIMRRNILVTTNKIVASADHPFLPLSDSSELKFQLACRMQVYLVLLQLYQLANVK